MSTDTDTDYIAQKTEEKNDSDNTSNKSPNYTGWIMNVISNFIQCLIIFAIAAGAMANRTAYSSKDDEGNEIFSGWLGTESDGTPYCCPGKGNTTSSGKKSAKNSIKEFFDLSIYNKPYNLSEVRRLLADEIAINKFSTMHQDDANPPELPEHLQPDLDSRIQMYPWAIRSTAYSFAWMRKFFQAGILSLFPKFEGEATWPSRLLFIFGGGLLLIVGLLMSIIAPLMTIGGAIASFKSFAWIGFPGWIKLFCMLILPGFLYLTALFMVPCIAAVVNHIIQPLFYLGFLLEPLYSKWELVKNIMIAHSDIIGYTGIIITIMAAFSSSSDAPAFGIGVLIASFFFIALGPAAKHFQKKSAESSK